MIIALALVFAAITVAVIVGVAWRASDMVLKARVEAAQAEGSEEQLKRELDRALEREDRLLAQVQDLSQRLASIRIEHPGADSDDKVYNIPPGAEPYSEDLQRFLSGVESEEARLLVEEQIESLRQRGVADEQILERVSEGEDIY